jgi:hypothetical protein
VTLRPGFPLVVAPQFHLPIDWSQRLLLGTGLEREGEGFFPQTGWRVPDESELKLLVLDAALPFERQALPNCLCLFHLPQHLIAAWCRVLENAEEQGRMPPDRFDAFVAQVVGFLAFKELPVPEGARFDLLLSKPGLPSVLEDEVARPRLWGGMNLGDEATSLVFINLAPQNPALCPDYPPVRLRIDPGEGFRLPAAGVLMDCCTLDKQEPDVLLLVRNPNDCAGQGAK